MTQANSCLTGYRLRPVDEADLAHHPGLDRICELGQLWAEPDIDHAARWMRLALREPRGEGADRSGRGRRPSGPATAPRRPAAAMTTRLDELAEGLAIDGRHGGRGATDVTPSGSLMAVEDAPECIAPSSDRRRGPRTGWIRSADHSPGP